MPTVTVLAWCLIASIGRVSSSMPRGERGGEVLHHGARRADLAVLELVGVERAHTGGVPQHRRDPDAGAGLERAVVPSGAQALEESARRWLDRRREPREQVVDGAGDTGLDRGPGLTQWTGGGVDRERGLVAEEMAGDRGEDEVERRVHRRHRDHLGCGAEAGPARLTRDHDRHPAMRAIDRNLFADVVDVRAFEPRRAHERHRLRRQVDVLLVLGGVAGDRLVAELRQLDAQLVRRDRVRVRCRPPPTRGVTTPAVRAQQWRGGGRGRCASRREARAAR